MTIEELRERKRQKGYTYSAHGPGTYTVEDYYALKAGKYMNAGVREY